MWGRATVVLDVGKTLSKLSLWAPDGQLLHRRRRQNSRIDAGHYAGLDAAGIEAWLVETLRDFARVADVSAIIPVAHGAAAAIVRDGLLVQPPLDYEQSIPAAIRRKYDAQRDAFALSGSPALPDGLNLGAQPYYLETLNHYLLAGNATILPWPQYWSWLLSGVAASEVTSLGCHTDLWRPLAATPSELSVSRGWAAHMAPRVGAGAVLGHITKEWAEKTGLPRDVRVHCGLHDSNAALLAARAFREIDDRDATVLSTGTWFVGMRAAISGSVADLASLPETRDCLVNVDPFSRPVPSARFMGGREIELLTGADESRIDIPSDQPALLRGVPNVLASDAMILPTYIRNTGPFPNSRGRWLSIPGDETQRRTAVGLYAALVADVSLDLIGARECLLIEGRFAECEVFARALAALRPDTTVYVGHANSDVSFGALRLLDPALPPPSSLSRVLPLTDDLNDYRQRWRALSSAGARSEIVAHTDHDC